jgi:hypothetical protein
VVRCRVGRTCPAPVCQPVELVPVTAGGAGGVGATGAGDWGEMCDEDERGTHRRRRAGLCTAPGTVTVAYLDLLALYSADLERSRWTWQILTGREPQRERHGDGPAHFSVPMDNGTVVELYPAGDGRPPTRARLQLTVAAGAVADTIRVVTAAGVEVRSRPWGAVVGDGNVTWRFGNPNSPATRWSRSRRSAPRRCGSATATARSASMISRR